LKNIHIVCRQSITRLLIHGSGFRILCEFSLRAALSLHLLLFLPLHFFLAFLKTDSPHGRLLEILRRCNLPTRFARLSRSSAVILIREAASPAPTASAFVIAAATASVIAPRRTALLFGARLVYFDVASADFFTVEGGNRFFRLFVVRHLHESEASSPPCFPVHRHVNAPNLPEGFEQRAQIALRSLKAQVSYE
jgi:hypothetical protein